MRTLAASSRSRPTVRLLELTVPVELDVHPELGPLGEGEPDAGENGERRGERGELRTSQCQRADQAQAGQRRIDAQLRGRGAGHSRTGCSTAGVGTTSRSSRTMSSERRRSTQSSGLRDSRCASAGTATAFTSSGVA